MPKFPKIASVIVLLASSVAGGLFAYNSAQKNIPLPRLTPNCITNASQGGFVVGCGTSATGHKIYLVSKPIMNVASAQWVIPQYQEGDEYIYTGEWSVYPDPVQLTAPVDIHVSCPGVTPVPITPSPTTPPSPTPPPAGTVFHPGTSGQSEALPPGWCTMGFSAYYDLAGKPLFGQKFAITNAHCCTEMTSKGFPSYANPLGKFGFYIPALGKPNPKLVGKVIYWSPVAPPNDYYAVYDACAVQLNAGYDMDNVIPSVGNVTKAIVAEIPIGTRVAGVGVTGGYREAKLVCTDCCIQIATSPTTWVSFCDTDIIYGIKYNEGKNQYIAMQPGDSGTMFVLLDTAVTKTFAGLGFAGSSEGYGVMGSADLVLQGMHLSLSKP
jgi:hypothetical protein